MDVKGALTRKIGPLPAWGWGVAVGGTVILYRIVTGKGAFPKSSSAQQPTAVVGQAGNDVGSSAGVGTLSASDLSALSQALIPMIPAGPIGPRGPAGPAGPASSPTSPPSTSGGTTAGTVTKVFETWQQAYKRLFGVSYGTTIPQTNLNNYAAHHRTGSETWQQAYARIFGVPYGTKIPQANLNNYAAHHRIEITK